VARAGTTTRYHFGNNDRDLCTYGNVADRTKKARDRSRDTANCRDGYADAAPVGSFQPNAFGLYDVHGNAWEWVQDCWNDNYNGAPSDGSARTTGDCRYRVVRGGAWWTYPRHLRSANRGSASHDSRDYFFSGGFRVGRTPLGS